MPWFALRTRNPERAEQQLSPWCEQTYLPKEKIRTPDGKIRQRLVIPRILFISTDEETAIAIERESRELPGRNEPVYLYRNADGSRPGTISPREMQLMMLLTADNDLRCEVYQKDNIREGDRVRVISGPFEGYEGYARRIRKNRHIVVEIEGICAVALPYIHPSLLRIL